MMVNVDTAFPLAKGFDGSDKICGSDGLGKKANI